MKAAWAWWVAFWSEEEPPVVLAVLRILVGLVILQDVGSMLWTQDVAWLFVDDTHGGLVAPGKGPFWLAWLGGATWGNVIGLLATTCLFAALLTVGLGGRLVPLVLIQLLMAVFDLHPGTGGGHDRVMTNLCWLLVLGPSTATFSVDAWRRTGRWHDPTPVLALARRLGVFQLVLMYTVTGFAKQGSAWFAMERFTAVYRALLNPSWARWDLAGVLGHPVAFAATQLGTVGSWWWEALWPVLLVHLLLRHPPLAHTRLGRLNARWDLRWPFVVLGVVTHGVLFALMNLGPFSAITLSLYVTLLRPDDRVVRWLQGAAHTQDGGPPPAQEAAAGT